VELSSPYIILMYSYIILIYS